MFLQEKINIYYLSNRLTKEQYEELTELLKDQ